MVPDAPASTRLSVVLPAYNEATTVAQIIDQVLALQMPGVDLELIIVESNSTDGTREVVTGYRDHPQVRLILQDRPSGKGNAVRAGLGLVTGQIVLIQDADLEYRVEEYPKVLAPILAGDSNFVLGCRHAPGKPMRHFEEARHKSVAMNAAHWAFTGMFNVAYGTRLRDPFTMYKVFRAHCIEGVPFYADRFDFDWELVAKLVRRGHRPVEVPITYTSRGFESGKKVRFFRDPLTWMVALLRFRIGRISAEEGNPAIAMRRQDPRPAPAPQHEESLSLTDAGLDLGPAAPTAPNGVWG